MHDDNEDPHEDDVHHVDLVGGEAGAGHVVAGASEHLLTLTRVCVECLTNVARVHVSAGALARGIVPDMSGGVGAFARSSACLGGATEGQLPPLSDQCAERALFHAGQLPAGQERPQLGERPGARAQLDGR